MLEKDNMTRHIKFLSYWIKTILFLTFTITKKDTNSRSRGQLTAFYMRTNNKTSTIKNSKDGIITGMLRQLFERRKTYYDKMKLY
jgi:DNA polymerase elongation subunit (family B)